MTPLPTPTQEVSTFCYSLQEGEGSAALTLLSACCSPPPLCGLSLLGGPCGPSAPPSVSPCRPLGHWPGLPSNFPHCLCTQPLWSVGEGLGAGAGDPMARFCPWPWLLKGCGTPQQVTSLGLAFPLKQSVLPCLSASPQHTSLPTPHGPNSCRPVKPALH